MKRLMITILALVLLCMTAAYGEEIVIDLSTATDEEISEAIDRLQEEQVERYKEKLENQEIEADADGITFREIPWYTTLDEAEEILGQISTKRETGILKRLNYIDYSVPSSGTYVSGEAGTTIIYSGLTVAGYTPSSTKICYIFPIVDDQIVREFELAEIYMGYYEFESSDFADLTSIYDDLLSKLSLLYGEGKSSVSDSFTNNTWEDEDGNIIRLQVNAKATYLTLAYVAATADERIDEMAEAYNNEQIQAEEEIRRENVDNTDGL